MSTPKNHHYVTQRHIRNFFNYSEQKIYCYDKILDNYYFKETTKTLFSEDFSNSRITNSQIDHKSLEDELNLHFEQDFEKHSNSIIELANNPTAIDESQLESLYYLARYSLISDIRIPENKKKADDLVDKMFKDIARKVRALGDEKQAEQIEKSLEKDKRLKYSNLIHYTKTAIRRLQRMGDLDFNIYKINSSDIFILPDTGCTQLRDRINNYINPYIKEIAILGIPLTEKVFVYACSKKVGDTSSGVFTIDENDSKVVHDINVHSFESAIKTVVASDKAKLNEVINKIKGCV